MLKSIKYCNLPGKRGPKWPKLEELYIKLFDQPFIGAHDAMGDVQATRACFYKLVELGVIQLEKDIVS
jgi:hypothetical protein